MPSSPLELLRARVRELDEADPPTTNGPSDPRLQHFVIVMGSFTDARMEAECTEPAVISADAADLHVEQCELLRDIAADEPYLISGSERSEAQHWVATGRYGSTAPTATQPRVLHTSTATRRGPSMWRTYLNLHYEPMLYPLPWRVWELQDDGAAVVLEIASARAWVDFVQRYPRHQAAEVFPDWSTASRDYDGVHLTLRAIVAIQGLRFHTECGLTGPQYWDVETTRWLSWVFRSPSLLETATEVPTGA